MPVRWKLAQPGGCEPVLAQVVRIATRLAPVFADATELSREQRDTARRLVENGVRLVWIYTVKGLL